ncbi:hypothetical protein [Rhodanobacter spathiphylli]|nr:hypothetical protein [Rhodanobacter spathiphylli]
MEMRQVFLTLALFLFGSSMVCAHEFVLVMRGGEPGWAPETISLKGNVLAVRYKDPPPAGMSQHEKILTTRLDMTAARRLGDLAASLDDFEHGCGIGILDGMTYTFSLDGEPPRHCNAMGGWPKGANTRAFLVALSAHLPKMLRPPSF